MKPIQIPKLKDHSTKFDELEERRAKLAARLSAVEAERFDLGRLEVEPIPADPAATRIAALLGEVAPTIEPSKQEKLASLAVEARDLRTAIDLVYNQLRVERTRASAVVRELVAPEYRRRVLTLVAAMKAAHAANIELQQMKDALEDEGVEWTGLGPVSAGHPKDPYGPFGQFLKQALDYGFVDRRDIPEELRQ